MALSLAVWASSCYSEYVYGITSNAAGAGLSWDMTSVLPKEAGLSVNGVVYQYTPVKNTSDPMLVHVQNLNARGDGYIFRSTDDWTGRPGGYTINKLVPVDNIPISYWGKGSIEVEGAGQVLKPNVVYTYRIDPCFDPQSSPSCPGYKPVIPEVQVVSYDVFQDEAVKLATRKTEQEYKEVERRRLAKEQALRDVDTALTDANSIAQSRLLESMNMATNLASYYSLAMSGGVYRDTLTLVDSKLSENRHALRNGLAQQLLHTRMVDQQYER